jgi:predicted MFS family arabinose efflux permease
LFAGYLACGIGLGCATLVPAAVVIANWFEHRRGFAMGLAMAGAGLGTTVAAPTASYIKALVGWRWAFAAAAAPILLIVLPMIWTIIRMHPACEPANRTLAYHEHRLKPTPALGLSVEQALRQRSFWLTAIVYLSFSIGSSSMALHLVPYLTGIGYTASSAAWTLSLAFLCASIGLGLFGLVSDRIGVRPTLAFNFALTATSYILLVRAARPLALSGFVLSFGIAHAAPLSLITVLEADSFGLKHLGTLTGLIGYSGLIGASAGPIATGYMFDRFGTYAPAFVLFSAALTVCCPLPFFTTPFQDAVKDAQRFT